MATAVLQPQTNYTVFNSDTRLGDDTIGPGLADDLQNYYEKTDDFRDRAKCLELLNAINTGENVQKNTIPRPYTAMPFTGRDRQHQGNFLSPYQTSYNRDYPIKKPLDTVATRPMTSHGFPPQLGPGQDTHYMDEFRSKAVRPTTPLRPGSASGQRSNNPHPSKSFLVWKFPRCGPIETEGSKWSEELTDEKINQVHKRMCSSTYQTDYLGVPQGFQLKSAYSQPPDWKDNIPYTLDTVKRYCYQSHQNPAELQVPSTRYGSNRKKQIAACGTIPTASARHMHIRNRTTYDRHFNDNSDAVVQQVRELGHKLGTDALRKYYEQATGNDDVKQTMTSSFLPPISGLDTCKQRREPRMCRISSWGGPE
ncbi:uncharacterized protein LOC128226568 isoform X2 [Mya arenaria]|uniref:uncharacterized protein LOC128226568 isoform X2 n=1 Tax=Mya arenaria TaxID=6604 RepID=UPI0022DFA266|nr:uncharacterized protein LOC128226568 isoform X2 [Mya arenaria]